VNVRSGLGGELYAALDAHLADADAALVRLYPGDDGTRQPIHTVYLPADRFHSGAFPAAADRLRSYLAGTSGGILDEPATVQALAAILVRGLNSGALDADEVTERSGCDQDGLNRLYRRRVQ